MTQKSKYILIAVIILYVLMRLSIIITSIDKIHLDEELYRGNIAEEFISRPILPIFDYQRSEYEGGSLIMGVLAVPFFILFGKTLFSLKLAGLFFSTLTFIAGFLFLDRFFHRRVAILAALLWIFSPPNYMKVSLFSFGSYLESNFFTLATLYIFYQIFFIKEKPWLFVLLGLVSGFALFFSYIFSVTLAVILIFWFVFDKRFILTKSFLLFGISFLCGFSPWIYYNATHHFEGLIVADKPIMHWFTINSLSDSLLRLKYVATNGIVNSFGFQNVGFIDRHLISDIYYLLLFISFCGLLFINRKSLLKISRGIVSYQRFAVVPSELSRHVLLITFSIVYFIILSVTGFEFRHKFADPGLGYLYQYRFFLPMYPFIFALIAIFCHAMFKARRLFFIFYVSLCSIIILLLLGVVHNFDMVSIGNFGNKSFMHTIYRGYNYYDLGKVMCRRFSDPQRAIGLVKGIKKGDDRRYCYEGMGWGFGKEKFDANYHFYISRVLSKIDRQYWPDACERLGLITGYNNDLIRELRDNSYTAYLPYFYRGFGVKEARRLACNPKEYIRLKDGIDIRYQPYFYEGMGVKLWGIFMDNTEDFVHFNNLLDEQSKASLYKGIAEGKEYYQFSYGEFRFGIRKIGYDINAWNSIINKIEDTYKPFCYQRLGVEIGWRFIHDIKKYLVFSANIDEKYSPFFYKGMGTGIGWRFGYTIDGCVQLIKEADRKYWPYIYKGLGAGISKRYSCRLDECGKEIEKIPKDYQSYFQAGMTETSAGLISDYQ